MTAYKRKLIEVALPLDAINEACRPETENPFLKNHPRAIHVWWARTPLVATRAVIFASLVDDPSSRPDEFPTEEQQDQERQRLFEIIRELCTWDNTSNDSVLTEARAEIAKSTGDEQLPFIDPFAGRGSIPLEAQRLGLEVHASDLNPVAVLITKALIEIPPKFAGMPPVNPESQAKLGDSSWRGAQGLAADVRHYGRWMAMQAAQRVGHLYPKVTLPRELGGGEASVAAWLWTRTVTCPNPACGAEMPLVRSFALSTKAGKRAWIEPTIDASAKTVRYGVRTGEGAAPQGTVSRQGARCVVCGTSVPFSYVRTEAKRHGLGVQLMAIVAEGNRARTYVAPDDSHVAIAQGAQSSWRPEADLPHNPRDFKTPNYGMGTFADLFTERQLTALTCFSDLIPEVREQVLRDAEETWPDLAVEPSSGATAAAYAAAVATYLGLAVGRMADYHNGLATWNAGNQNVSHLFQRQAIPMAWDFTEANAVRGELDMTVASGWVAGALTHVPGGPPGIAGQLDAVEALPACGKALISTDPPYYDNIGYADLSDFFYVWLRRSLGSLHPALFSTLLVPKQRELIASPSRFAGDATAARDHFETGFARSFALMREKMHPDYPLTVYYAYAQSEQDEGGGVASTGWETMLTGLVAAGFEVTGTWPMRTTKKARSAARGMNALASAIVLVCRPRASTVPLCTRREFLRALKEDLPGALRHLRHGNVAPVDFAQAAIGPGMAVFSRYSRVMETDGTQMSVRTALSLINQVLDEVLAEQEGEFDADTRWAIAWFEQFGVQTGEFGDAETLSKAKGTSVEGMVRAGILEARAGKVRLLRRDELDPDWDPASDRRLTVWEMTQYLLRRLDEGEVAAAALGRQLGSNAEVARDLAYRLYLISERRKWTQEALAYNALVVSWPQIQRLAVSAPAPAGPSQTSFEV